MRNIELKTYVCVYVRRSQYYTIFLSERYRCCIRSTLSVYRSGRIKLGVETEFIWERGCRGLISLKFVAAVMNRIQLQGRLRTWNGLRTYIVHLPYTGIVRTRICYKL